MSHTAVVIDLLGRELETRTFPTTRRGIDALIKWARLRGTVRRAGVEGTGSYGAGLAQRLALEGIEVFEVTRPSRRGQRHRGKTDDRDALAAARVVLSGEACAIPKTLDGIVESIRVLRNTRASAVKARTQAGLQLRSLVLTAPTELREVLRDLSTTKTVARCARWHRVDHWHCSHRTWRHRQARPNVRPCSRVGGPAAAGVLAPSSLEQPTAAAASCSATAAFDG